MILSTVLTSGAVWLLLEQLFFVVGIVIIIAQLYFHVISPKKALIWGIAFFAIPILTCIAWMFIGRPWFRHRLPTYTWEDKESIDALMEDHPDDDNLRLARTLCAGGALHYSRDSRAEYIGTAEEYYRRVFDDIRLAETSICIECYLIRRDETSREFIGILCEKARAGIDVRIMFDDYGYDGGTKAYLRQLENAGARAALFHNMTRYLFSPKKNYRDHRKTIVIDGRVCYQGGFNIGDEHLGGGRLGHWRDAAVRIEGPQAQQMLRMFADDWEYTTHESLKNSPLFHGVEPCGDTPVQILPGDPVDFRNNLIETEFVALSRRADKRMWIATPYFAPTAPVLAGLCAAAASGVDVRIIIPDKADHPHVYWGNRRFASKVMRYGAKVYEYHDGFIHSKTIVCDGSVCSIGSANYDVRSVSINFECNVVSYSKELGAVMEKEFLKDQEKSTEYTMEMYESRGVSAKFRTGLAMLFSNQL